MPTDAEVNAVLSKTTFDPENVITEEDVTAAREYVRDCLTRGVNPVGPHPLRTTPEGLSDPLGPVALFP